MATGHIRKRIGKNGGVSYQIVAESDRDPTTGKRERIYGTVKGTKKQAEAALRKLIEKLEMGVSTDASAIKLRDWMDTWLTNYLPNIEATTRVGYKESINNYINKYLGNTPLKALKTDSIQTWINKLHQRGLGAKTIRNAFNNLNAALKKAVVLRMLPYNPCVGTVLPKLKRPKVNVYNAAEIQQLLKATHGTTLYLPVVLAVLTGMRRGEVCALKWSNVDFEKKLIHICENRVHGEKEVIEKAPKSEAGNRKIPISRELATILSAARMQYYNDAAAYGPAFRDLSYVLHNEDGTPYHPDSLTKMWRVFMENSGLRHIRFHDLRHSNATALIAAGVNPKTVQQLLGHSDVTITLNTYTHVLPYMEREAVDTLDSMIFNTPHVPVAAGK